MTKTFSKSVFFDGGGQYHLFNELYLLKLTNSILVVR